MKFLATLSGRAAWMLVDNWLEDATQMRRYYAAVVRADGAGHAMAPCPCMWGHGHLPQGRNPHHHSPPAVIIHDPAPIAPVLEA